MDEFAHLLHDLAATRLRLETLRARGGCLEERASLGQRLHTLRSDIAAARRTLEV